MPTTPVYGFRFEDPDEQPGVSLTGGSSGTEDILAEQLETELIRIEGDVGANAAEIVGIKARLDALEAGTSIPGWTPIQAGASVGANFDVDLTDGGRFSVGEFDLLRMHMRFDLAAVGYVRLLVNNDGGGGAYNGGIRILDADNPAADLTAFPISQAALGIDGINFLTAGSWWRIGHAATVSTNNLMCTIFHTNGNNLHSFQCTGTRASTSGTTHAYTTAWGNLTAALSAAPSTLRLAPEGTTFAQSWWWVEGYRVPA